MGESRRNPRSTQYKGTLPDNVLGAEVHPVTVPSPDWLRAHPPVAGQPPATPSDDDLIVEYQLFGTWVCPSSLVPQEKWPAVRVPLMTLLKVSIPELRAKAQEAGMVFPEAPKVALVDA